MKYTIEDIRKFLSDIGSESILLTEFYEGNKQKLEFICSCGRYFVRTFSNIQQRKVARCRTCSAKLRYEKQRKENNKYEEVEKFFSEKGLILLEKFRAFNEKILCKTKDGFFGRISYANLLKGKMFAYYSIRYNEDFLLHNLNNYCRINNIKAEILNYTKSKSRTLENIIECKCECGEHFKIKISSFLYLNGYRCPKCSKRKSSLEIKVEEELIKNSINYKTQYTFDDCKNPDTKYSLRFDFYLPEKNILLEVDGKQHYYAENNFGHTKEDKLKNFLVNKKRDSIKNDYAEKNNIKLIRITYKQIADNSYKDIIKTI